MSKATKMHLENITMENLTIWRSENAYCSFASSTGRNGNADIGVNGYGDYVVRQRIDGKIKDEHFQSAQKAIDKYTELVSD